MCFLNCLEKLADKRFAYEFTVKALPGKCLKYLVVVSVGILRVKITSGSKIISETYPHKLFWGFSELNHR